MFYMNKITNDFGITLQDARRATPHMTIPDGAREFGDFEGYDDVNPPAYDPVTQHVREVAPAIVDGVLTQQWEVYGLTPEQAEANRRALVPQSISRAQGKVALISAGMWAPVLGFVDAIGDPTQKALAEVALHDTTEWRRDSPFLNQASAALGMTDRELDDLFTAAGQIVL